MFNKKFISYILLWLFLGANGFFLLLDQDRSNKTLLFLVGVFIILGIPTIIFYNLRKKSDLKSNILYSIFVMGSSCVALSFIANKFLVFYFSLIATGIAFLSFIFIKKEKEKDKLNIARELFLGGEIFCILGFYICYFKGFILEIPTHIDFGNVFIFTFSVFCLFLLPFIGVLMLILSGVRCKKITEKLVKEQTILDNIKNKSNNNDNNNNNNIHS